MQLELKDVNGRIFGLVLDLWCGRENDTAKELNELKEMANVADRLQMTDVLATIEQYIIEQLSLEVCSEALAWSCKIGLRRLENATRRFAVDQFEELSATASFVCMDEEVLGSLLDDDGLNARNEEFVWEALAAWMRAGAGQLRGRALLGKIRFPLMSEGYLQSRAIGALPAEYGDWIAGLVGEALRAKAAWADTAPDSATPLGPKSQVPRAGKGVRWSEYVDGGVMPARLEGHTGNVHAVAECQGRVCSGSWDGTIRVWNRATLVLERTLRDGGDGDGGGGGGDGGDDDDVEPVSALAVWEGRLISGHFGAVRVWDVATGACEQVLEGHTGHVMALAVCGRRLVSGSEDETLMVWALGPAAQWACEATLLGHTGRERSLAAWRGKALSGSSDRSIRVWDLTAGGAHDTTLSGHEGGVCALAVHGDRLLLSASEDGTIRAWALGTWTALRAVAAHGPEGAWQHPRCLAVSGVRLVSGSRAVTRDAPREVRVWRLDALEAAGGGGGGELATGARAGCGEEVGEKKEPGCESVVLLPAGEDVTALAAVDNEVWAGIGSAVVVWGRRC
jgi:hypothetical protein